MVGTVPKLETFNGIVQVLANRLKPCELVAMRNGKLRSGLRLFSCKLDMRI